MNKRICKKVLLADNRIYSASPTKKSKYRKTARYTLGQCKEAFDKFMKEKP